MTAEQRRKHFSDMLFEQWSKTAKAYAGRPERKKVESREVKNETEIKMLSMWQIKRY